MRECILSILGSLIFFGGFYVTYMHNAPDDDSWGGWILALAKAAIWPIFLPIDIIIWNRNRRGYDKESQVR